MVKPLVGKKRKGHVERRFKALKPQLVESTKTRLLIRGQKTGEYGLELLQDFKKLKPQTTILFSRKNELFPFDDEQKLQFICEKNDAALFAFASNSKKRPNDLVLGRLFDNQLLDMFEFGIENYTSFADIFKVNKSAKSLESETCIIFQGNGWESELYIKKMKNFFLDFFKGRVGADIDEVALTGLDHLITLTLIDGIVYFRSYYIALKKPKKVDHANNSDNPLGLPVELTNSAIDVKALLDEKNRCPEVELIEMGPRVDLKLRRHKLAPVALENIAFKHAKLGPKKVNKNIKKDIMDNKIAKVHMNTRNDAGKQKSFFHLRKQKNKLGID